MNDRPVSRWGEGAVVGRVVAAGVVLGAVVGLLIGLLLDAVFRRRQSKAADDDATEVSVSAAEEP